jgi:hypothetical protein
MILPYTIATTIYCLLISLSTNQIFFYTSIFSQSARKGAPQFTSHVSETRIEKPVWPRKPLATGMTGYRENRSKTTPNLNFEFKKSRIGKPVGMTGKPVG